MRRIKLTRGKVAMVDNDDYQAVIRFNWQAWVNRSGNWYVRRWDAKRGKIVYMHRELMMPIDGEWVDHKNRDGLDNRRENLRICVRSQNQSNSRLRSTTGFKGVRFDKRRNNFAGQITIGGKNHYLGTYPTAAEAAMAYDIAAVMNFRDFARTNHMLGLL